jgi:predicted Zn-dependent protease
LPTAIAELDTAVKVEPRSPDTHRFLAIAYGREGNEAMSKLELAEQAILEGRVRVGRHLAEDAMHLLKAGSRDWLRAQDLVATSIPLKHDEDSSGLREKSGVQFSVGPVDPAKDFAGSR